MDKSLSNQIHAIKRARQRYKIKLTTEDLDAILLQIKNNVSCRRIRRDKSSLRRKMWNVVYNGVSYNVVVEINKQRNRESIVTFLPGS